jgi:hypothetical protein
MWRAFLFVMLANSFAIADDAPPIAITSPDQATTYPFGSIKQHSLIWDKKRQMLIARIVFMDVNPTPQDPDDTHDFRLPGVRLDATKNLFYAISAKGEAIPVAKIQRELFLKAIEMLPNAAVRVQHTHGQVTVILEALRPDDPALKAHPAETNSEGGHSIDIQDLFH